jgi:hypothetical protein
MKIILTIKEANEILKERFGAKSCNLKNPYDGDRGFELEVENNKSPNKSEKTEVSCSATQVQTGSDTNNSTKQELNKEIVKDWLKEKREFGKQRLESAIRNDAISVKEVSK